MNQEIVYQAINAVTAANELRPGINTSVVDLLVRGRVILDPFHHQPIEHAFSFADARLSRESQINLQMLADVRDHSGLGVWLSPPDSVNTTGKILVAKRVGDTITQYDTTGHVFNSSDFSTFFQKLYPYHRHGYFFIPSTENPWEVLSQTIPMPEAWESMQNLKAEFKFHQEVKTILSHISANLSSEKNPLDLFHQYYQANDNLNISQACQAFPIFSQISFTLGIPINFVSVSIDGGVSKFIHNCGQCQTKLNIYMKKGDHCPHCHGEYQGC